MSGLNTTDEQIGKEQIINQATANTTFNDASDAETGSKSREEDAV